MEILVRRNDLVKELQLVQGIVERKNSIPILSNVLAEARGASCASRRPTSTSRCAAGVPPRSSRRGRSPSAPRSSTRSCAPLPESDVSLRVEDDAWTRIRCERVEFKMAGLPREDFPSLPDGKGGKAVEIPAAVLRAIIQRTKFAITAEDARYYLAGALLVLEKEAAAMVATDGHRLAWAQRKTALKVAETTRVLVPRKAISELERLIEEIGRGGDGRLPAGRRSPDLHRGRADARLEGGRGPVPGLREGGRGDRGQESDGRPRGAAERHPPREPALLRARPRGEDRASRTGKLEVSASSPELGEARESLPVEYAGEAVEIGFNAQYLLEFLGVVGTDEVALEVKDAESQGLLRPVGEDGGDYRYVVMPMRF